MNTITEDKKTKLHIVIVLDRSGSMSLIRKATVRAFNKQVETLHDENKENLDTKVSLITFSDFVDNPVFFNIPLKDLKKITCEHYEPFCGTALNDSMGTTILRMLNLPNYEDTKFLMISITDGDENSSIFLPGNENGIKRLIKMMESQGNWTFTYLAANNPIEHFVDNYGAAEGNVQIFDATNKGMKTAGDKISSGLTTFLSAISSGESSVSDFWR